MAVREDRHLHPHKLHEVKAIADRVTVLRGGKAVATVDAGRRPRSLAALMVGREIVIAPPLQHARPLPGLIRSRSTG